MYTLCGSTHRVSCASDSKWFVSPESDITAGLLSAEIVRARGTASWTKTTVYDSISVVVNGFDFRNAEV
jgi:hypothetical protein